MEGRVYFTKGSAAPIVAEILETVNPAKCLCIYARKSRVFDGSVLWHAAAGARFVEFADYGRDAQEALVDDNEATLIVIGLSDMIRPSNRCDIRFEYMYNFAKVGRKYVIDHVPFLEEKWRVWYPYGVIDPGILLYPHSYAIESAYRNYEDGMVEDDPLEMGWLIERLKGWTRIDYRRYFEHRIEFAVHPATDEQKRGYEALKEQLFATEKTVKPIIAGLARYCQSILPKRTIFTDLRKLYRLRGDTVLHMTDLKVDWYLRGEIERVISETNQLTEGLYEAVHRQERA